MVSLPQGSVILIRSLKKSQVRNSLPFSCFATGSVVSPGRVDGGFGPLGFVLP